MVTGPKTKPLAEVQQIYDRNSNVGKFIKDIADAQLPETGVTRLPPTQSIIFYKHDSLWRYAKGYRNLLGKAMGGKFAKVPPTATPSQKAAYLANKKKRIRKPS